MLRIYRGKSAWIDRAIMNRVARHERPILLFDNTEIPACWTGFRTILAMVHRYAGKGHFEAVAARHRAALSCACPAMPLELGPEDRAEKAEILARAYTHSNRNHQIGGAAAAFLADLLDGQKIALFIPNPERLDFTTFMIVKHLRAKYAEQAPELHIGIHELGSETICHRGINWSWNQATLENEVAGFLLDDDAEEVHLDAEPEGGAREPAPIDSGQDRLFGPLPERIAYESLLAAKPLDAATFERVYEAAERAFERHSFRFSLKIATTLIERAPELGGDYQGRIQALAGTIAHFYHFSHETFEPLDAFLEACFRGGLSAGLDPDLRMACWFRLMFTVAERMDEPERAKRELDRFLAELERVELPPLHLAYQRSWANFIRCYISAHVGGTKDEAQRINMLAYDYIAEAESHLDAEPEGERRYWAEELSLSRFNLAAHSVYLGERLRWFDFNRFWYEVAEPLTYGQPKAVHFEVYHWVHHNRFILEYEESLRRAEIGIADARESRNGGMCYIFLFCAADLCDRMGRSAQAVDYLERAIAVRPRLCNVFRVASHQYLLAKTRFRAGLDAAPQFEAALEELPPEDLIGRCNARGFLAQIAAREGKIAEAESILNQLIEAAQEAGVRDLILAVLLHVADTCDWLDRREDAVDASTQAWEILSESFDESVIARQAVAALRRLSPHTISPDRLVRLFKPFRKELDYGDTWWLLKDFLKLIFEAGMVHPESLTDPALSRHLEFFSAAALVREDCAGISDRLRTSLGPAGVWPVKRVLAGIAS